MTVALFRATIPEGDNMSVEKIYLNGVETEYELVRKNVKNVNLRVKGDGMIYVSANRFTSKKFIEDFIRKNSDFILRARERQKERRNKVNTEHFSEDELKNFILNFCKEIYPYYEKRGIAFPLIKFRKMKTMWGNCRKERRILTFNLNLKYAPKMCVEYVVYHEFTHFFVSGHGKDFYYELSKVCHDWKEQRSKLKEITLG